MKHIIEILNTDFEIEFDYRVTVRAYAPTFDDPGAPMEWEITSLAVRRHYDLTPPKSHEHHLAVVQRYLSPTRANMANVAERNHRKDQLRYERNLAASKNNPWLDLPPWLEDLIKEYLYENDDVREEIEND